MSTSPPPRRGRPRDPERLQRVLEAAAAQFTTLGFDRTSIDLVAQCSGVSKMTVYSYFPTKEALFEACISERCNGLFDLFLTTTLDPAWPEAALLQIGRAFLRLMRDDKVVAMHRMMFASAATHPELCQAFYLQGPQTAIAHLADYLAAAAAGGHLRIGDANRAANQFLALFLGAEHVAALLGLALPSPADDEAQLQANVGLFLRAHAAD